MKFIRLLLFPFSLLYGLAVMTRNLAYDLGVFKVKTFNMPVISVGNLAVGGAGKSPMVEYLVRLLKDEYKLAALSRGYGRKTTGFLTVNVEHATIETGDEPLQFKKKFKDITVAVCEDRVKGIERLKKQHELILLDDAYQHRAVKPGLSILLFDYNTLFKAQWLLPTGNLREPLSSKKRADLIVVTKTPEMLDEAKKKRISKRINAQPGQPVFFSYLGYDKLTALDGLQPERSLNSLTADTQVFLLTGIANPAPLLNELKRYTSGIYHHNYPDHHPFSTKNISKLAADFNRITASDKIIITTEKDAQRLANPQLKEPLKGLPVYYLPVRAKMHEPGKAHFDQLIKKYAAKQSTYNRVH